MLKEVIRIIHDEQSIFYDQEFGSLIILLSFCRHLYYLFIFYHVYAQLIINKMKAVSEINDHFSLFITIYLIFLVHLSSSEANKLIQKNP